MPAYSLYIYRRILRETIKMRTVGYIPKKDKEQGKEPITEQGGTPAPPEPPADTSSTTPPEPKANTGKKGGEKE